MTEPQTRSALAFLWIDIVLIAAIVTCNVVLYRLLSLQMEVG